MPLFPTLLTLLYFAAGSMFGYVIRECFSQASGLLNEAALRQEVGTCR